MPIIYVKESSFEVEVKFKGNENPGGKGEVCQGSNGGEALRWANAADLDDIEIRIKRKKDKGAAGK